MNNDSTQETNTPNNPAVVDMGALLNRLLSAEYIPKERRDHCWILASDDIPMSFHDPKAIALLLNQFRRLQTIDRRSLYGQRKKYSTKERYDMLMDSMAFSSRTYRSINGEERKTQATQIQHNVVTEKRAEPENKTGYGHQLKRLVGLE